MAVVSVECVDGAAAPVGGGGAWPGFKPTRRAAEQRPGPTGVEGAGGAGGPGCGARGRWWGMVAVPVGGGRARAGLEIDHSEPSGSRVAISRAGRRPPAHGATRPSQADHAQWAAGGPPPTAQPGLTQHAAPGIPAAPHRK